MLLDVCRLLLLSEVGLLIEGLKEGSLPKLGWLEVVEADGCWAVC